MRSRQATRGEAGLAAVLRDPVFEEALWVASPSLAAEAEALLADSAGGASKRRRASLHALARYVIRATTRATPFGAFAGVAVASWSDGLDCRLQAAARHVRKVRLDHVPALALARSSEREGRLIDTDQAGSMEKKKQEGYF